MVWRVARLAAAVAVGNAAVPKAPSSFLSLARDPNPMDAIRAAARAAEQREVIQQEKDIDTVAEGAAAAEQREAETHQEGAPRLQELESQNEFLEKRNSDLQKQIVEDGRRILAAHQSDGESRRVHVLETQVRDLKSTRDVIESDKRALVQTVHTLMKTNETQQLERQVDELLHSKLVFEHACQQAAEELKVRIEGETKRAQSAMEMADALRTENLKMRTNGQTLQEQAGELLKMVGDLKTEKEGLHDVQAGDALRAMRAQNSDLEADLAELQQGLRSVQRTGESLQAELRQQRLQSAQENVKSSDRKPANIEATGNAVDVVRALQEENLDLQRGAEVAANELQELRQRVGTLESQKEQLIQSLQQQMRRGDQLKANLKQASAEMGRQHKENVDTTLVTTTSTTAQPWASTTAADLADPIADMHKKAAMLHSQMRQTEMAADTAAAGAEGEEDVSTTAAPTLPALHLSSWFSSPDKLSAVDALDPEARVDSGQAGAETSDDVTNLLDQAQSAVNNAVPAF